MVLLWHPQSRRHCRQYEPDLYPARVANISSTDSGEETIILLSGLYERLQQIRDQTAIKRVIITDVPETLGWPF
ncbi:MAG: hypothetical protein R2867_16055 [Caldilineaceae bacterium]